MEDLYRKEMRFRLVLLGAGFVSQVLCGLVYAWSLFNQPLQAQFGWNTSDTSLVFTISLISMVSGMITGGILDKHGKTRLALLLSAVLCGIGFVASSFTASLIWIYVFYGFIGGFGVGLNTDVAMSVVTRWFPDKQGVASGTMLMGFGMGAFLLGPVVNTLITGYGWSHTFVIVGIGVGVMFAIIAIILRSPEAEFGAAIKNVAQEKAIVSKHDYTSKEMMNSRFFWVFVLWLIIITSGGLALISVATDAAVAVLQAVPNPLPMNDARTLAAFAMGFISLFNGFGRLINGYVWDRFGYRFSLVYVSCAYLSAMLLCAIATVSNNFPLIVVGFVILGLSFGGDMSCMVSMCNKFFGTRYFNTNFAVATCQEGVSAAVGPMLLARLRDMSGNFVISFWVFAGTGVVAFILQFLIKEKNVDCLVFSRKASREDAEDVDASGGGAELDSVNEQASC